MSSNGEMLTQPVMLRLSNAFRNNVSKQNSKGYQIKKRSMIELFMFNYIPGLVASTLLAPLNRLKVILQIQTTLPLKEKEKLSATEAFKRILKNEGSAGLFKGNAAYSVKLFAQFISKILIIDRTKNFYKKKKELIEKMKYKILGANLIMDVLTAFVASTGSLLLTHPFDLAFTRMAADYKHDAQHAIQLNNHKKIGQCFYTNATTGIPFTKYYTGITASLSQSIVYSTIVFTGYQLLSKERSETKEASNPIANNFLGPVLVALIAGAIVYPFDTIKRIYQTNEAKGFKNAYKSYDEIFNVCKSKGLLYKGFSLHLMRALPFSTIQFFVFQNMVDLLQTNKNLNSTQSEKNKKSTENSIEK